jgi:hypothetical protein
VSEYTASETVRMPRVTDSAAAPRTAPAVSTPAPPPTPAARGRRARLVLTRLDPWSVMKLSFLLSIALGIVTMVAVMVLWNVLDAMGVFEAVSSTVSELTSGEREQGTDLMQYLGFSRVMGITAILAAVNVVLITALLTLAAFLYNITATLVGGLHVTLSDEV